MIHYKPWAAPPTACGVDTLTARPPTSKDLGKVTCPACLNSPYADRQRHLAEYWQYNLIEFGYWRTGGPEPVTIATAELTDEHLAKILAHLGKHLGRYALEGLPTPMGHMGDHASDGFSDALDEWEMGNTSWRALATPRFASIVHEALKRGWAIPFEEPDNGWTIEDLQVRGWRAALDDLYEGSSNTGPAA